MTVGLAVSLSVDTEGGKKEPFIKGYREYHTDTTVHFEIELTEKKRAEAEEVRPMHTYNLSSGEK